MANTKKDTNKYSDANISKMTKKQQQAFADAISKANSQANRIPAKKKK